MARAYVCLGEQESVGCCGKTDLGLGEQAGTGWTGIKALN